MARKTLMFYTVWGWASSAEGEAGQVCLPCFELRGGVREFSASRGKRLEWPVWKGFLEELER